MLCTFKKYILKLYATSKEEAENIEFLSKIRIFGIYLVRFGSVWFGSVKKYLVRFGSVVR